jgi:hypothetical protein
MKFSGFAIACLLLFSANSFADLPDANACRNAIYAFDHLANQPVSEARIAAIGKILDTCRADLDNQLNTGASKIRDGLYAAVDSCQSLQDVEGSVQSQAKNMDCQMRIYRTYTEPNFLSDLLGLTVYGQRSLE